MYLVYILYQIHQLFNKYKKLIVFYKYDRTEDIVRNDDNYEKISIWKLTEGCVGLVKV